MKEAWSTTVYKMHGGLRLIWTRIAQERNHMVQQTGKHSLSTQQTSANDDEIEAEDDGNDL